MKRKIKKEERQFNDSCQEAADSHLIPVYSKHQSSTYDGQSFGDGLVLVEELDDGVRSSDVLDGETRVPGRAV